MRVAFVQPRVKTPLFEHRFRGENLGLCSMAAALRASGHTVLLLDDSLYRRPIEKTIILLSDFDPGLIGIPVTAQQVTPHALDYIRRLAATLPDAVICTEGIFPSVVPQTFLDQTPELDCVVQGEGEATIVELVDALERGHPLCDVPGVVSREGTRVVRRPSRTLEPDLGRFATPARDTLQPLLDENRRVALSSARGCYGSCTFCSLRLIWDTPRYVPADRVVDEIRELEGLGVHKLRFVNDIFVDRSQLGLQWLDEFHRLLHPHSSNLNIWIQLRASHVVDEILAPMKELGLKKLMVGMEAGSQGCLDYFNKKLDVEANHRAFKVAHRIGVKETAFGFIMFHPFIEIKDIVDNLKFLFTAPAFRHKNFFSKACPFEGTELKRQIIDACLFDPGSHWYEVGSYRFACDRVQDLYDRVRTMQASYGRFLYAEAAMDVEERFLKGELRRRGHNKHSKAALMNEVNLHCDMFRGKLNRAMLSEFTSLTQAAEAGELGSVSARATPRSSLDDLVKEAESAIHSLQSLLDITPGFRLDEGCLTEILDDGNPCDETPTGPNAPLGAF